ncbi:MAG TPA: Ig-like domain-containing protein [Patescibacteria group bacterium]|nr:Ig-like domain-containing protein [Patescibacteria group bacterium]
MIYTRFIIVFLLMIILISCEEPDTAGPGPYDTDTTPPAIDIVSPGGDTVATSEVVLSADITDESVIHNVTFHVDDVCIAEDDEYPYEQTWYAGYWTPLETYTIVVRAEDEFGNAGASQPREIVLAGGTKYSPTLLGPENMAVFQTVSDTTEVVTSWEPVPGAKNYTFRYRTEGFIDLPHAYVDITGESFTFLAIGHLPQSTVFRIFWSIRANWDSDHGSLWGSERWFSFMPAENADIRDAARGVRISFSPRPIDASSSGK